MIVFPFCLYLIYCYQIVQKDLEQQWSKAAYWIQSQKYAVFIMYTGLLFWEVFFFRKLLYAKHTSKDQLGTEKAALERKDVEMVGNTIEDFHLTNTDIDSNYNSHFYFSRSSQTSQL